MQKKIQFFNNGKEKKILMEGHCMGMQPIETSKALYRSLKGTINLKLIEMFAE